MTNNTGVDIYFEIQLKDINGNTAEIFNANPDDISWTNKWQKIGVEVKAGARYNDVINLSSAPDKLGGLTAVSWDCPTAVECPLTEYQINASKISQIIFLVNGGAGTMNENPDYPDQASGDLVFNYFSIGETTNSSSNVIKVGSLPPPNDNDMDGVDDDLDTCRNTVLGQMVDAQGCSSSQRDSDNDGVSDFGDQCPNTPAGASVDANGCSISQRDSDNDGVTDDQDICPNTPAGSNVDSDGCIVTGIKDASQLGIHIYPNPANNFIYVEQNDFLVNTISITDVRGINVMTSQLKSGQENIDISNLSRGVYTITLSGDSNTVQESIIIK